MHLANNRQQLCPLIALYRTDGCCIYIYYALFQSIIMYEILAPCVLAKYVACVSRM